MKDNTDNNDIIKQENKQALPKFILIIVMTLAGGLILGFLTGFMHYQNWGDALAAFGVFFTTRLACWLLAALPIVELALCLPIYFGAKKQLAAWDSEDEGVSQAIEKKLSVCIFITSIATILSYFLAAAHFAGMVEDMQMRQLMSQFHVFLGLIAFLAGIFGNIVFQQKLVDATKQLNPEKQGSVYDTKFHQKWLASCDEAERAIIGQCALKAYQAMSTACLILWLVFVLGGITFDCGFLPAMAVCVVWGVGQAMYSYWAIKLNKPGEKL